MNCLQSRRLLLAAPREISDEHRAHIAACDSCARLAHRLVDLERSIEDAALVPVPDALVHRVLLRQRGRPRWRYAVAAVVALFSTMLGLVAGGIIDTPDFRGTMQAVGPSHPAVVAISEVMDRPGEVDDAVPNGAYLDQGLRRLGLSLKPGAAVAYHVGTCRMEGVGECEHIVLRTPQARANVILVAHYPESERVLVADRRMVALMTPAGSGAYIVVADSAKAAKSVDKLFVRGEPLKSARVPRPPGTAVPRG
jgi:hypothetical protein